MATPPKFVFLRPLLFYKHQILHIKCTSLLSLFSATGLLMDANAISFENTAPLHAIVS